MNQGMVKSIFRNVRNVTVNQGASANQAGIVQIGFLCRICAVFFVPFVVSVSLVTIGTSTLGGFILNLRMPHGRLIKRV